MATETVSEIPAREIAQANDRWPHFDGMPADARQRMQRAVVAVIGVGSVGRAFSEHMARMGVGKLVLVDDGILKHQSPLTHAGVFPTDAGQSKTHSAADMIKQLGLKTQTRVYVQPIQDIATADFLDADFIAFATDNLAAEVAIGQCAAHLGKPLLQMSVQGESLLVHLRSWTNRGDGSCPRCLYNAAEEASLVTAQRFSCEGSAVPRRSRSEPTRSISALCSLAGAMGATIVLRHLLSLGAPLVDEIIEWCGYTWETWRAPTHRRDDCQLDHGPWRIAQLPTALANHSLRHVTEICGIRWGESVDFELDSTVFAVASICEHGHEQTLGCFISRASHGLRCDSCGSELTVPRTLSRARVPASMLSGLSERPLGDITPVTPRWVIVRDGTNTWLVTGGAR